MGRARSGSNFTPPVSVACFKRAVSTMKLRTRSSMTKLFYAGRGSYFLQTSRPGHRQVRPTATKDAMKTARGLTWTELAPCPKWSAGVELGSLWKSAPQQRVAEASQCLPSSGMASASSAPWPTWRTCNPPKSFPTTHVAPCHATALIGIATGTPTKSTSL
jgi:hypothetical protein